MTKVVSLLSERGRRVSLVKLVTAGVDCNLAICGLYSDGFYNNSLKLFIT